LGSGLCPPSHPERPHVAGGEFEACGEFAVDQWSGVVVSVSFAVCSGERGAG